MGVTFSYVLSTGCILLPPKYREDPTACKLKQQKNSRKGQQRWPRHFLIRDACQLPKFCIALLCSQVALFLKLATVISKCSYWLWKRHRLLHLTNTDDQWQPGHTRAHWRAEQGAVARLLASEDRTACLVCRHQYPWDSSWVCFCTSLQQPLAGLGLPSTADPMAKALFSNGINHSFMKILPFPSDIHLGTARQDVLNLGCLKVQREGARGVSPLRNFPIPFQFLMSQTHNPTFGRRHLKPQRSALRDTCRPKYHDLKKNSEDNSQDNITYKNPHYVLKTDFQWYVFSSLKTARQH